MIVQIYKTRPRKFNFISALIMLFQGMKPYSRNSFSHMAIGYITSGARHKIIDSTGKGVRPMLASRFLEHNQVVDCRDIQLSCDRLVFESWLDDQEGKEYDRIQIFGLFLEAIGLTKQNKIGSNYNKLTCNELVICMIDELTHNEISLDSDSYDLNETWSIVKAVTS